MSPALKLDGESERKAYLETMPDGIRNLGLGYFGSRNIDLERQCHQAIQKTSDGESIFDLKEGREILAKCDEFSNEVSDVLLLR